MTQPTATTEQQGSADDPSAHHAHHVQEFGDVPNLVHVPASEPSVGEESIRHGPVATIPFYRWKRLWRRLYRPRHLMQYFFNDTLYRTAAIRKVSSEELFLDLVIVAVVASLGHELRATAIAWPTIEKFILLFTAVYASWRQVVILWNLWGIHADVLEKTGIYVTFVALVGIALGAHAAFDDGVRPYVAVSAFAATAVPTLGGFVWSSRERLLKNPANRINQPTLTAASALIATVPYLIAAFVGTPTAARALFWTSLGLQLFFHFVPYVLYKCVHRDVHNHTRLALNIELIVEKYEVLTMIVLGETVIGILFEGGAVVGVEGARVGHLYLAAVAGTAMLYSLQTFYVQVDSPIQRGGKHAVRHSAYAGLLWSLLHMPYHFFLILFATGLGVSARSIGLSSEATVRTVLRATSASGSAQFDSNARWLFAVGWGGSLITSALIGLMHIPGPRAATKRYRACLRSLLATAMMVGMPFANISAMAFVGVFAIVTAFVSMAEFVFVQMDRIGFFRSQMAMYSSSESAGDVNAHSFDLTESDSEGEEGDVESGELKAPGESEGSPCMDENFLALKERLCKHHCSRLMAVKTKKKASVGVEGGDDGSPDS